ncbi:MAG: glutathione peroxidase [Bacteroidetes bacterium]|nr:glutathione peroxidase [Bacteroidota bacterium]
MFMKNILISMGILTVLTSCFVGKSKKVDPSTIQATGTSIYDIKILSLDGKDTIDFSRYKGKYVVVVNTASECGYTPQYKDLQDFHSKYKDSGVVVIGCPCNQFGGQEPGTPAEIGAFCQKNYGVTFTLTEKIDVKGDKQHPLYQWLTKKSLNGSGDFDVKWNFNKFVISPEGKLLYYFGSSTKPGDSEFVQIFKSN